MKKQETFTDIEYSFRKKKTKREEFLEIMDETLRRTSKTTLRSYDSRASGDQECPYRQGRVANVTKVTDII